MAKIVTVTLGDAPGSPAREGWVILNYVIPEGGRSNIGVRVAPKDGVMPTWGDVAADLLSNMNGRLEWPKFVEQRLGAGPRANQIRISCPNELNPAVFVAEFNPRLDQDGPHELSPPFVVIEEERF